MLGSVASERELKPVYLLTGTDRPKIAIALQRLRGRIGEDATEQLHAGRPRRRTRSPPATPCGLFGGDARLVVVDGVETWKAADVKELEALPRRPRADHGPRARGRRGSSATLRSRQAVAKAGQILAYDVSKKQLPEWVAEQFAPQGVLPIVTHAVRSSRRSGTTWATSPPRSEKLATWAGGEPITRAAVEELASRASRDADLRGNRLLGPARRRGDSARGRVAARPLAPASLGRADPGSSPRSWRVGRVRKASRLADEGVRSSEIASRLKIHPFVAEKSAKQAG